MSKVQYLPWWWAAAGTVALIAAGLLVPLGIAGWTGGLTYLVVSSLLLSRGLARRGMERFGPANAVTETRSLLVGVVTALVVASLVGPGIPAPALLAAVTAVALVLDAADGIVARRTGSVTELGGRFDMEVDAFLLLVLCTYDARLVGWWILAIGLLRYAFVAAGWILPWMRAQLPPRYWRKVVTAACGILLTVIATGLLPPAANVVLAGAALLLVGESFGRDVVWLARARKTHPAAVNRAEAHIVSPTQDSDDGSSTAGAPAVGPAGKQV